MTSNAYRKFTPLGSEEFVDMACCNLTCVGCSCAVAKGTPGYAIIVSELCVSADDARGQRSVAVRDKLRTHDLREVCA